MKNAKTKTTLLWIASVFFLLSFLVFLPHVNAFFCLLTGLLLLPVAAVQRLCSKLLPRKGLRQLLIAALVVLSVLTLPSSSKNLPDDAEPTPSITDTAADENETAAETAAVSETEADTAEADAAVSEVSEDDISEHDTSDPDVSGADTSENDTETSSELSEEESAPAQEDTPAASTAPADAQSGTQTAGDTTALDGAAPAGNADVTASDDAAPTDTGTSSQEAAAISYVLNTSTMKFHYESCRDVDRIKAENYAAFTGSRDDLIAQGYSACGHCHP